ncbi:MAG: element excision factor XisI family protein [Chloroflexota bacterium]|nr:element excision factor XisI family protein [Chloroflexota bacterium]
MDTQTRKETLIACMKGDARVGLNGRGFFAPTENENLFAVVYLGKSRDPRIADAGLMARIHHDKSVIELDMNDKMRVDAPLQAGVPRDQIVLAYVGESIPAMDAIWQRAAPRR